MEIGSGVSIVSACLAGGGLAIMGFLRRCKEADLAEDRGYEMSEYQKDLPADDLIGFGFCYFSFARLASAS